MLFIIKIFQKTTLTGNSMNIDFDDDPEKTQNLLKLNNKPSMIKEPLLEQFLPSIYI